MFSKLSVTFLNYKVDRVNPLTLKHVYIFMDIQRSLLYLRSGPSLSNVLVRHDRMDCARVRL